jgi:hypothetical protein
MGGCVRTNYGQSENGKIPILHPYFLYNTPDLHAETMRPKKLLRYDVHLHATQILTEFTLSSQ